MSEGANTLADLSDTLGQDFSCRKEPIGDISAQDVFAQHIEGLLHRLLIIVLVVRVKLNLVRVLPSRLDVVEVGYLMGVLGVGVL